MRDYTTLHSNTDWSKGTACSKKEYGCDWTWETIQHYTQTHIEVEEHERLCNITRRHKLKERNMRDYPTLHVDTNFSKATACSKKEYGCDWTRKTIKHYTQKQIEVKEHERLYNITLRHRLK